MQSIIDHVSNENKEWVTTLEPKDIAKILDTLVLIPGIININSNKSEQISELPANVGLYGEMKFQDIIQQNMPSDYVLVNTAKIGKCGDFIITYSSAKTNKKYSIIIDVKNYKTTVPTKEIDKFYRDITLNYDIHGGILLSLNSKIVGSKIIDFKKYSTNNGNIPIIFIKSDKNEVICEMIKLIFHMIEIKDINRNTILDEEELINTINELNDDIQLITKCRDNLQNSKMDIEKSLNEIMFNLMQCEYKIASKIKQINNSLSKNIHISESIDPAFEQLNPAQEYEIRFILITFKSSIELGYESLLYTIYNLGWDKTTVDIPKKQWIMYKTIDSSNSTFYIYIKFNKKSIIIIFPIYNDLFIENIKLDKKGKMKSDGYNIPINPDNMELILNLCKCI
jgi:hypothetical protein